MVIANPTYFKRTILDSDRTAFYFRSLVDYTRFINEVQANADQSSNARRGFDMMDDADYKEDLINSKGVRWFGTTDESIITNNITDYLFNNELDTYLQNVRSSTMNVDKVDIDQVKTIKFTEQEIGIFSFDLASLGLIPVFEYYSPLLKRIVDNNFVRARKDENNKPFRDKHGKIIFYHVFRAEVPKHSVEFNNGMNGYYSEVLGRVVEKQELILDPRTNGFYYPHKAEIPEHEVRQDHKLDKRGKKMFTTTWKKSFIHIPKVEKPLPRIDIIVASSFYAGVNAETEMIYSSMAAIALAERLSKANINYRIIVAYPVQTTGSGATRQVFPFVVAKQDGEALDKQSMAVLLSDGRQFRYQQFRGFYATQYDAGFDDSIDIWGVGRPINDSIFVDKQYTQEEADKINARGGQQVSAEGNGDKYIFRDLDDLSQNTGYRQEFNTQEEAYEYIRQNGLDIDRVKIAYMDYLAMSDHPEDIKASTNWGSKVLFSGALNQQQAENEYEKAIRSITNI
jgi:hypothetical protein